MAKYEVTWGIWRRFIGVAGCRIVIRASHEERSAGEAHEDHSGRAVDVLGITLRIVPEAHEEPVKSFTGRRRVLAAHSDHARLPLTDCGERQLGMRSHLEIGVTERGFEVGRALRCKPSERNLGGRPTGMPPVWRARRAVIAEELDQSLNGFLGTPPHLAEGDNRPIAHIGLAAEQTNERWDCYYFRRFALGRATISGRVVLEDGAAPSFDVEVRALGERTARVPAYWASNYLEPFTFGLEVREKNGLPKELCANSVLLFLTHAIVVPDLVIALHPVADPSL